MIYRSKHTHRVQNDARVARQWLDAARRGGQRLPVVGNAQPRFQWDARVTLESSSSGETAESHYATTRDISATDLNVRCRWAPIVGEEVRITLDETGESITGTVLSCAEEIGAFVVTLRFAQTRRPSRPAAPRQCVGPLCDRVTVGR